MLNKTSMLTYECFVFVVCHVEGVMSDENDQVMYRIGSRSDSMKNVSTIDLLCGFVRIVVLVEDVVIDCSKNNPYCVKIMCGIGSCWFNIET